MNEWDLALRVFAFGFCGVFITLTFLMVSIFITGAIIRATTKKE